MSVYGIGVVGLVELMAETMPTACLLLDSPADREPSVLYANPAFTRLTGYSREELQGAALQALSSDVTETAVMHRIRTAMRSGRAVRGVKTDSRKTGEIYMCELAVRPLHDDAGRVSHYLVFEREVRRRRGRPPNTGQRFEPVAAGEEYEERLFALD